MTLSRARLVRSAALASAAAVGLVPIAAASASAADAAPAERKAKAPSEKTPLPVCAPDARSLATPQFYGTKVTVGFFDGVKSDGRVNKVRAGSEQKLEFRLEDGTNGCVIPDPDAVFSSSTEVACSDLTPVADLATDVFASLRFDAREKHFEGVWLVPEGKNRCFIVTTGGISALFRTR